MLSISLISLFIAVPLFSYRITPNLFNRITCVTLIYASYLSFQATDILSEISIYNGLFHVTNISLGVESFIFLIGAIILLGWTNTSIIPEYSIMILFTTIGASLLVSSSDLVSMFLSIELQSFAVYVLATLYRGSESAGLKYFLLGGLSSALILLGTALIYTSTGVTHLEGIYNLISVPTEDYTIGVTFGMLLIGVGFLFKVASAPFHNWAPDVYDGTPTIVTSWLSTIPKISIFVFLLESNIIPWKNLLLIASLLSLIIGTVLGLSQIKIKRLLTYSTISHVGFLLLALAINSEESIESFLFYLFQYSITNITIFLVLLGFSSKDVETIQELKGKFYVNPLLCLSFALCLFSIAGIPPLLGFFAKQIVLYSSIHEGHYFLSIVAILVSVISASYYLKIVQVMYFNSTNETDTNNYVVTNMHSIAISTFTMVITLFVFQPIILLNGCHLLALSLFYY